MSTVGIGVDVVDVERFEVALGRHPALITRLFTDIECRDAHGRAERLAARFAAKEAVLKTLGVGIGAAPWRSIEVLRSDSGAPTLRLHGAAAELATRQGVDTWHLSISHTKLTAAAFVMASTDKESSGAR